MRYWTMLVITLVAYASPAAAVGAARAGVEKHRTEQGAWRLDVTRNRFSGAVLCRLQSRDKHMLFLAGAVGLHFSKSTQVNGAEYKLDGGAIRTERDDLPELVRLGTPFETGGITNSTRGIVWVPVARLTDVRSVTIQSSPAQRPRTFRLRGLRGLYELAQARGCVPDSRFVE